MSANSPGGMVILTILGSIVYLNPELLSNELGRAFGKRCDGGKWIHSHRSRDHGPIAYYQTWIRLGSIAREDLAHMVGHALLSSAVSTYPGSPSVQSKLDSWQRIWKHIFWELSHWVDRNLL